MSLRVFAFGNDKLEAVENARVGLERMEREIRAAYPVDTEDGQTHLFFNTGDPGTTAMPTEGQITFGNELGAGDGEITCPSPPGVCEYITYKLSGNTLMRNATAIGSTSSSGDQPVIEFVNPSGPNGGLKFEYLDANGTPITDQADIDRIDRVRIALDVLVEGGQQDGTQTLTTEVELRNQNVASTSGDSDGDGVPDDSDACPDEAGDQADGCPAPADGDTDGIPDASDNCPTASNPDQADLDSDGAGDACDDDRDGDGVPNTTDECPDSNNPGDGCPTTGISVNDPSVAEGNSGTRNLTLTVTRNGNLGRTSTVDYATANGSATSGSDYAATSGTLTFAPNETTKTVNVVVNGDTTVEPNETLTLNLSNPTRATIADGQGTGTITNDDTAPQCSDGIDNGPRPDGKTDHPTDGGCSSATDNSENQRPTAVADSYTVDNDVNVTNLPAPGVLGNDTDPDGDTRTVITSGSLKYTQPKDSGGTTRGTVVLNTNGSGSYDPPNTFVGNVTFTYSIFDGRGGTDTATVTVTVVN